MHYLSKLVTNLIIILILIISHNHSIADETKTRISIAAVTSANDGTVINYISKMEPDRRGEIINGIDIPFPKVIPKPEYYTKKAFYKYQYIAEVNNDSVDASFYLLKRPDSAIVLLIAPTYCRSKENCNRVYMPTCKQFARTTYQSTNKYPFSGKNVSGAPLLLDYLYLLKCPPYEMMLDLKDPCPSKSKGEKIKCLQKELTRIDNYLNVQYKNTIKYSNKNNTLKVKQRQWIKKRNQECLEGKSIPNKQWINSISSAEQLLCLINYTTYRSYLIGRYKST